LAALPSPPRLPTIGSAGIPRQVGLFVSANGLAPGVAACALGVAIVLAALLVRPAAQVRDAAVRPDRQARA